MNHQTLRNAGLTGISALALTLVACGGSNSSNPPVVTPVNQKPTIQFINVPATVQAYHQGVVTFVANDPDGTTAPTVTVNGTAVTGTSYAFAPTAVGTTTLKFSVSDGKDTVTQDLTIVVTANNAPTLNNAAITVGGGTKVNEQLPVVDIDKDTLAWAVKSAGPNANFAKVTGNTLAIDATGVAAGTYDVVLTATEKLSTDVKTDLTLKVTVGALPAGKVDAYPNPLTPIVRDLPFSYQLAASSPLTGDAVAKWEVDGGTPGSAAPKGAAISATGLFTWTADSTFPIGQQVVFGLKATFTSGVVGYQVVQLTPGSDNHAPTWSAASENLTNAAITKLNGTKVGDLAFGVPAVVLSSVDKALTYELATSLTPADLDLINGDAVTFTTKAVQIGSGTLVNNPDVSAQVPGIKYTPGSYNAAGTYTAGTLTIPAPVSGTVKDSKGHVLGSAETAATAAATDLFVTIEVKDKAGKTATAIFGVPVRQNAGPVIDTVAKAGTSKTDADKLNTFGGIVSAQPAEGAAVTWTLAEEAPHAAALKEITDLADGIADVSLTATVDGKADTRFSVTKSGTNWLVKSAEFTANDARKPYTFTLVATDVFGAKSAPVTFQGNVNGTIVGSQAQTWYGLLAANAVKNSFLTNTVTINPYYSSGVDKGWFNSDAAGTKQGADDGNVYTHVADTGSTFHINSVPAGFFYAKTSVTTDTPFAVANTWVYTDQSNLKFDNASATRLAGLASLAGASVPATKAVAATATTFEFGRVANPNAATDFMQLVNPTLGISHFFHLSAAGVTVPEYAATFAKGIQQFAAGNTSGVVLSNNNDDLKLVVDWNGGYLAKAFVDAKSNPVGDVPVFGLMTNASIDGGADYGQVQTWKMTRSMTPTPFAQTSGAAQALPKKDFATLTNNNKVALAISRTGFIAQAKTLNAAATTVADQLKVYAWPGTLGTSLLGSGIANGPVQPSAPIAFATQVFDNAKAKDVNLGSVEFATLPGFDAVYEYTYNFDQKSANANITGGVLPATFSVITATAPAAAIAPAVTPVTDVQVSVGVDADGVSVFHPAMVDTGTNVGTVAAPVLTTGATIGDKNQVELKWTAVPNVSGYIIEAYDVTAAKNFALPQVPVATVYTATNDILIPQSLLVGYAANNKYIFKIKTVAMPGVNFATEPFKVAFPKAVAESWTGVITWL